MCFTAYCFRNTLLEDIHADNLGRNLDNQTIKELMIESSSKVTNWLKMRDALQNSAPSVYDFLINTYQMMYTCLLQNRSAELCKVKLQSPALFL